MYFSAGVASLAAFGAAVALPREGALWLIARLMLDLAGGLFGFYVLMVLGLSLTGRIMRARNHIASPVCNEIAVSIGTDSTGSGSRSQK